MGISLLQKLVYNVPIVAMSLVVGCGTHSEGGTNAGLYPELILTQHRSFQLASGENVLGAVPLGRDAVVYWGSNAIGLVAVSGSHTDVLCRHGNLGIVGGGVAADGVVLFDSIDASVFLVSSSGKCRKLRSLPAETLTAGVTTDSGWLIIDRLRNGKPRLVFYRNGREQPVSRDLPGFALDSTQLSWLYLSRSPNGAFIGTRQAPFSWASLSPEGNAISVSYTQEKPSVPGVVEYMPFWYSLPVLDLDQGYLQVLADLRSDRRRFVIFDKAGMILRMRDVVAPMGIFSRHGQELLGMRMLNAPEIVEYRWRWHQP